MRKKYIRMLHMYADISKNIHFNLPFLPTTIGYFDSQARVERPKGFEFCQFIWVTDGEGIFHVGGISKKLTKNMGFFSDKNIPHSYHSSAGAFSTMWVTFFDAAELLSYYNANSYFFFDVPDFLSGSTMQLIRSCEATASAALRSSYGYSWTVALMETLFQKALSPEKKVTAFLEKNFDKPVTLDTIAEHINSDKYTLCRNYMKNTGMTVMQALKQIRIQKAKSFLLYSTCSVEQIGIMCGFESPSYFIKVFREQTGMTPRSYRTKSM